MYELSFDPEVNNIRLYVCKPDETIIGELKHVTNRKISWKYGAISELTFNVPYKIVMNHQIVDNPIVPLILGDYLIKYVKGNHIVFFKIINPEHIVDESGKEELIVTCKERHYEWKDKIVRLYKGTKKLYDPIDGGVLNETLEAKTDWKVAYIDGTVATKFRTFDESQRNLLDFVYYVSERYGNVIPIVDTVNKTVSFYLDENLGVNEGLYISDNKYLKSLSKVENFDDIVTKFYIYGKDNISINSISPTGTDNLEDFSFYMHGFEQDEDGNVISHSPYMSDDLCKAIIKYNQLVESKTGEFQTLLQQRESLQQTLTQKENELFALETELRLIEDAIDVGIKNGDDLTNLNQQKNAKLAEINAKKNEIASINTQIDANTNQISALRTTISIENNFTPAQIIERNKFIRELVWQDNNYTNPNDLLTEGKERLKRASQPIVSYTIDVVDFTRALNTPFDWNRLKLGGIVTIHYPRFNINIDAKVIEINHEIDENRLILTIANSKDIKQGFLKIADLINRNINTSTTLDMNKGSWDLSTENNLEINKLLNSNWDANKRAIEAGNNLNYRLDERGLTLKDPNDPMNFLRAVHNVLAITNDGGNTYKNAITYQGVVAERLYGQIIAGQNLIIQNTSGTVRIDSNGFNVQEMTLSLTRNDDKTRILMNATDGFKIQSKSGSNWIDKLFADVDGNLTVNQIIANTATIKNSSFSDGNITGSTLSIGSENNILKFDPAYGLWAGNSSFTSAPFRVGLNGIATMTGANISGNITMTSGCISWANVNAPTPAQVGAVANNQTAVFNALTNNGQLRGLFMSNGELYMNADYIRSGVIDAQYISTNISQVNNVLNIGTTSNTFARIVFGGRSNLEYDSSGNFYMTGGKNIYLRADGVGGTVRVWNDDEGTYRVVATREWVQSNAIARFA